MRNEKTKVAINYDTGYDTVEDLQTGDYFIYTDGNAEPTLHLYINEKCIIDVEEGALIEPTYFNDYDEIKIIEKVNITIEE